MELSSHVFVPKQVIASEEEVKELLERLRKPVEALPFIFDSDPGVQGLNAKAGDIVRVERASFVTKKTEPFYRLVVESED